MPICITCSTPVKNLYTTYSKADDRSLGKGVRLTQCPKCKRFADKYVEHDYVVLFIDLVLIKPQVYRHLLFNRLETPSSALDPSILRLGIILVLFDVYITWARIERASSRPVTSAETSTRQNFSTAPIITQYLFFLTLNVLATIVQHLVIRTLAKVLMKPSSSSSPLQGETGSGSGSPKVPHHHRSNSSPTKLRASQSQPSLLSAGMSMSASTTALDETLAGSQTSMSQGQQAPTQTQPHLDTSPLPDPKFSSRAQTRPGPQASPAAISTALLVSSCTKLFPILLVIWPTTTGGSNSDSKSPSSSSSSLAPFAHRATSYIGWVVLVNNIEALLILLDCGYVVATTLALAGLLSRWVVEGWLLGFVGLVRELEGPVGDALGVLRWIWGVK